MAALYLPPSLQKMCLIGLQSQASLSKTALSGRHGGYTHAYGICATFYCISIALPKLKTIAILKLEKQQLAK